MKRQEKVVSDAIEALLLENGTVAISIELIEKYMKYIYSIGHFDGSRLIGHGKRVRQSKYGKTIAEYNTAAEASRFLKCSERSIQDSCNGKQRYGGFDWEYF